MIAQSDSYSYRLVGPNISLRSDKKGNYYWMYFIKCTHKYLWIYYFFVGIWHPSHSFLAKQSRGWFFHAWIGARWKGSMGESQEQIETRIPFFPRASGHYHVYMFAQLVQTI